MQNTFAGIYRDKKVLITGDTGFKGAWLSIWLNQLGAKIYGLANGIPTQPSLFEAAAVAQQCTHYTQDIRDFAGVKRIISDLKPDFVFHLAAQSLVRRSYQEPHLTFETNMVGTLNLLEALRLSNHPATCIAITSDKVYENNEWVWGYRENDTLGGKDPYSNSKAAAEMVLKSYAALFSAPGSNIKVGITRAGNVIGGGDFATNRIVPDAMRAWASNEPVEIRSPKATRPWQHVLEPLSGYLLLGQRLSQDHRLNGEAFNFGPAATQDASVVELLGAMQEHWHGDWIVAPNSSSLTEANLLKLSCDKAHLLLYWMPVLNFKETVSFTVDWYRSYFNSEKCAPKCLEQINRYVELAEERKLGWIGGQ